MRSDWRAYFPGWIGRTIIGVMLGLVVLVRVLHKLEQPPLPLNDPAVCNLLVLIFSFIAGLTVWIWFCFRSGFSTWAQRAGLVAPLAAAVIVVAVFRVAEFSGSMVPRLETRWAPQGELLGKLEVEESARAVDLVKTTPDDFPQFLGPDRSCWVSGPQLDADWTAHPPKRLWKRPIGAGWGAFAAVNGFAVTLEQRGNKEWVACYEIETGKPVWGQAVVARHSNPMGGVGPRSTPTIHEGRVYTLGGTGIVHCLDGANGKVIWSDDLRKRYGLSDSDDDTLVQWGRAGSPLIVDSMVVVPGGGPSGKAKNLVAFDAKTGKVIWEAENLNEDGTADQIAYASPVLATLAGRRQILIVNESTVSGHDPTSGERLWSFPWPGYSSGNASASQAVAIDGDYVFVSKGYSGGAELIEIERAEDGDRLTATSAWKNPGVLQTKFTNVVVREGHVFGLSEGILECVDLALGKRKWKKGRYGQGQVLGVGNFLLVLGEDGVLHLVELTAGRFRELASIQALEGKTWNNLCLYGRRLLVRNGEEAACYELP